MTRRIDAMIRPHFHGRHGSLCELTAHKHRLEGSSMTTQFDIRELDKAPFALPAYMARFFE